MSEEKLSERLYVEGASMKYVEQAEALEAQVEQLETWKRNVLQIVSQSEGVAGWHENGDVAAWDEFEEFGDE